jgi:hypothetical protein
MKNEKCKMQNDSDARRRVDSKVCHFSLFTFHLSFFISPPAQRAPSVAAPNSEEHFVNPQSATR